MGTTNKTYYIPPNGGSTWEKPEALLSNKFTRKGRELALAKQSFDKWLEMRATAKQTRDKTYRVSSLIRQFRFFIGADAYINAEKLSHYSIREEKLMKMNEAELRAI